MVRRVLFLCSLVVVCVVLMVITIDALAQELPQGDSRNGAFRAHFMEVVALNPQISDFRKMSPGTEYNLPNGEIDILESGDTAGIWGKEFQKFYGISYQEFMEDSVVPETDTSSAIIAPISPPAEGSAEANNSFRKWLLWWLNLVAWVLLFCMTTLCLLYLVLVLVLPTLKFSKDPATSGPPMVRRPVTDAVAASAMQQVAAREAGFSVDQSREVGIYQSFVVLHLVAGRIWGVLNVRYADGKNAPRRLKGDRAYRADVRFPDGHTETLYMLQACGNDLRYGGISRYLPGPDFRFEVDGEVALRPSENAAEQPTQQPKPDMSPKEFSFRKNSNGDVMIRISGSCRIDKNPEGTVIRTSLSHS